VAAQPEATGFIAATRVPRAAKARHSAAAIRVLPTPVSVPVTNKAGIMRGGVTDGAEITVGVGLTVGAARAIAV
jgi:hypothetical protein